MIKFVFSIDEIYGDLSGFELGHLDIIANNVTKSSRNRKPDQAMMVFITIADLLNSYCRLIDNKKAKGFKLVGADSSFMVEFKKVKGKSIGVYVDGDLVEKMNESELAKSIYDSCNSFFQKYKLDLPKDDAAKHDVELALTNFRGERTFIAF